ncbi:MAG: transglutaminase domain-containing protein [Polaribacter sp.]|uniref:transglutaminase domain-containing protein n=1 Tax=Polaribacter sp. TaxID=1920175 RepID=UPI003BAED1C8
MQKWCFLVLIFTNFCFAQQSDFTTIDFKKADYIAKSFKSKGLLDIHKTAITLTENLETEVEKVRAIYLWICNNIANDYRLYAKNSRKRNKFINDSIRLNEWNSDFKKLLFKKLLKNRSTICTGYAYLFKEMCGIINIEAKMVNGFGRTSDVNVEDLIEPNHTWNVVKINNKWYLCDPTWSAGISYPEQGKFVFEYNDGYFLTDPKIFFLNHYPIEEKYALLNNKTYSLKEFSEMPLLYAEAYNILKEHVAPAKMHHEIIQNDSFTFTYQLKEKIDINKIKFIFSNGDNENIKKPEINLVDKTLTLQYTFANRGFYDVHLCYNNQIICTYTFLIKKAL